MKKKIPFDISYREKIESGEASVVTDCGEPVEIVKWDCKGRCPILAVIDDGDTSDSCFFKEDGGSLNEKDRLYLLVEDEELTEFEDRLGQIIIPIWETMKGCQECHGDVEDIKQWAAELLDLARKALRPEFDEELEKAYKNQDDVVYQRGYDAGFAAGSEIDEERLTDKIAEKIAEKLLKDGNPFTPNPVIPVPGTPPPINPGQWPPITVMYGVTPTEFRPTTIDTAVGESSAETSALKNEAEEENVITK